MCLFSNTKIFVVLIFFPQCFYIFVPLKSLLMHNDEHFKYRTFHVGLKLLLRPTTLQNWPKLKVISGIDFFNTDRLGLLATSLGRPFQCGTSLSGKKSFLRSSLNLLWCSLNLSHWSHHDSGRRNQHYPLPFPSSGSCRKKRASASFSPNCTSPESWATPHRIVTLLSRREPVCSEPRCRLLDEQSLPWGSHLRAQDQTPPGQDSAKL